MDNPWLDDFVSTLNDQVESSNGGSETAPALAVTLEFATLTADALVPDPTPELDSVPGTFTTNADNPEGFNIDLVFAGEGWTPDAAEQVIEAAELLTTIFEGDLPDTEAADGTAIDDKLLTLTVEELDGALLGVGGTSFPVGSDAPAGADATGFIRFDDQLVANLDGLDGVAYHEIMHTLGYGIGPVWDSLLTVTPDGQARFTGENAINAYVNDFGQFSAADPFASVGVPVDDNGDHVDVDVFGSNTIESGFITPGTPAEANLFELDMAIFEDLGYDTHIEDDLLIT